MDAYQLGRLISPCNSKIITRDSCTKGSETYFSIYLIRNGHTSLFKKVFAEFILL